MNTVKDAMDAITLGMTTAGLAVPAPRKRMPCMKLAAVMETNPDRRE